MHVKDVFSKVIVRLAYLSGAIFLLCLAIMLFFTRHSYFAKNIIDPVGGISLIILVILLASKMIISLLPNKEESDNPRQSKINETISIIFYEISILILLWSIVGFCSFCPIFERLVFWKAMRITIGFCLSVSLLIISYLNYVREYIKIKPKPTVDVVESGSRLNSSD